MFQFLDEPPIDLKTGNSVTCPSFKPHSFWNETDEPVQIQLVCSPAGLDQFFIESDLLLSNASNKPAELEEMRFALRTKYGLEDVGEPPKSMTKQLY